MTASALPNIVKFDAEDSIFQPGERVRISIRFPVGHYRVPRYIRGKKLRYRAKPRDSGMIWARTAAVMP
jgi:hypothetical protein